MRLLLCRQISCLLRPHHWYIITQPTQLHWWRRKTGTLPALRSPSKPQLACTESTSTGTMRRKRNSAKPSSSRCSDTTFSLKHRQRYPLICMLDRPSKPSEIRISKTTSNSSVSKTHCYDFITTYKGSCRDAQCAKTHWTCCHCKVKRIQQRKGTALGSSHTGKGEPCQHRWLRCDTSESRHPVLKLHVPIAQKCQNW